MAKAADIRVVQAEVNDMLGICVKIAGPTADVATAIEAGCAVARQMGGQPIASVLNRPDLRAWKVIESPREIQSVDPTRRRVFSVV